MTVWSTQMCLVVSTVRGTCTCRKQACSKGPDDAKMTKKKVLAFKDLMIYSGRDTQRDGPGQG